MITKILNENTYKETMENEVEPFLADLRKEGTFNSFDGAKIHYEYYPCDNAKASIVISHGFTESAEKFREMSYYFIKEGFNVFAIDHRGHGKSHKDNSTIYCVYVSRFDDYVNDLYTFVGRVVRPNSADLPLYLFGHSMGGAVAIRILQEHPEIFKKAFLNAPMVKPNPGKISYGTGLALTKFLSVTGKAKNPVFVQKEFNPNSTYERSHDTSKARFEYYKAKRIANDCYKTSQGSYRWVNESMNVYKDILNQANCDKIEAEVLLYQAGRDTSVLNPPQDEFISKIKKGSLVKVPEGKHEMYLSDNSLMEKYVPAIIDFFNK